MTTNNPLPVNTILSEFEVRPNDLVPGNIYLIKNLNRVTNQTCKYKGIFIKNEIVPEIISSFFLITETLQGCLRRNNMQTIFFDHSARYYTPPTELLMDESAQRQYLENEFTKMINSQDFNTNNVEKNSVGSDLANEYFPRKNSRKKNMGGRKTKRINKKNKKKSTKKNKNKIIRLLEEY